MKELGRVRRLFYRDGESLSEISRKTGYCRNTIKRWLKTAEGTEPNYRRGRHDTKITPYAAHLIKALETDAHRPKRDRRTALKLFQEIQAGGFAGDYSRVTEFVRRWRLPEGQRLWSYAQAGEPLGEIVFTMAVRHGQKARQVRQQLWARRIEIPAGKTGSVWVTCIVASEIGAPEGVTPVQWRLLTNREASTLADVIELIDWYRARWEIEMFFNVLKNGCRVEALQLSGIDRLERALALFMVVSLRITYLMRTGRTSPDLEASLFFDPDEIRGAYLLAKKKPPNKPPSVNEVLRLVATLGGFLARKGDGEPGVKTIWQGLQRVMDAATTLQSLRGE